MHKLEIGDYTYLKDLDNPLEVPIKIGKFCSLSFSLLIFGDDHACISVPDYVTTYPFDALWGTPPIPNQKVREGVTIGNDVWVGMHVSIRAGITIGDGAIIGAGTVVAKNVQPYEIVSGNPMQHMRFRFTEEQIRGLLEIKWWDWSEEKIRKNISLYNNINEFVNSKFEE